MSRPVIRWLLFILCLAVFAGALVWISQRMLRMETERREAEREAQVQERVRLALWRMESVASTLLIRENARPPFQYQAFYEPDDLYTPGNEPIPRGQIRTPSPLMGAPPDLVRLHFELLQSPPMLCSPQVPIGKDAALAQAWYVHPSSRAAQSLLDDLQTLIHQRPDLFQLDAAKAPAKEKEVAAAVPTKPQMDQAAAQTLDQGLANTREFQQRSTLVTQNVIQEKSEAFKVPLKKAAPSQVSRAASDATAESAAGAMAAEAAPPSRAAAPPTPTFAGDLRGEWIGENLFLLRQAELQGKKRLQGVWVDWAALQQRLLEAVKDLFPDASLRPAAASERSDPDTLVTLPIKLLTGSTAISLPPANRAVLRTLALAWISFGIAALAIAFVLQRALTLSERRGAFVSAVTHELRT
ncbi:MAG: hypothetical protein KDK99_18270, partial [Verrucomicrobiales bacterium]|nr:hypothetical protein [Verrucomicrobiales bacterium]